MLKKMFKFAFIAGIGMAVVSSTKLGSYFGTLAERVERRFDKAVPSDFELERIRREINKLDQDIEGLKGKLARVTVESKELKTEVESLKAEQEKNETWIRKKADEIKAAAESDKIKWQYVELTKSEAKSRLSSEVRRQNNRQAELESKEKMLTVKDKTRLIIEQQFAAIKSQKSELVTEVNRLEAEIQQAKLEQMENRHQKIDGTRLAEIKKDIAKIKHRLDIQRETVLIGKRFDEPQDADKSVDEILAELKSNGDKTDKVAVSDE